MKILFVCTGNRCRSPMAEAALAACAVEGLEASSCGVLSGGIPVEPEAVKAFPSLAGRVSRQITAAMAEEADLVIGMAREHVREVCVLVPEAFAKAFTLKEFVRGPSEERSQRQMLGADPDDDVADPIGCSAAVWARCVDEITALVDGMVNRLES